MNNEAVLNNTACREHVLPLDNDTFQTLPLRLCQENLNIMRNRSIKAACIVGNPKLAPAKTSSKVKVNDFLIHRLDSNSLNCIEVHFYTNAISNVEEANNECATGHAAMCHTTMADTLIAPQAVNSYCSTCKRKIIDKWEIEGIDSFSKREMSTIDLFLHDCSKFIFSIDGHGNYTRRK